MLCTLNSELALAQTTYSFPSVAPTSWTVSYSGNWANWGAASPSNDNFPHSCAGYQTALGIQPYPVGCDLGSWPLVFSVTQENACNTQGSCAIGSQSMPSSANHSSGQAALMSDYSFPSSIGTFINSGLSNNYLAMAMDTVLTNPGIPATNPATGWPLDYGHLFYGLTDSTVTATLAKNVYVEFNLSILGDWVSSVINPKNATATYPQGFAGHHITFGAEITWPEKGRANQTHYLEFILSETPGYSSTYGDSTTGTTSCLDAPYERCYYDSAGVYSEGRYLSYPGYLRAGSALGNSFTVKIPFSDVLKSLNWYAPPKDSNGAVDWSLAQFSGMYIGIESMGQTWQYLEVTDYTIYELNEIPSPIPYGLVVANTPHGQAGLLSSASGLCYLNSLGQTSYTQAEYNTAPVLPTSVAVQNMTLQPCSPFSNRGLFRIGNGGYLQRGPFYCAITGGSQLAMFGFSQSTYNSAPQLFVPDQQGLTFTGACINPS